MSLSLVSSIYSPNLFTSQVVIITGGASGIGLRCAKEFLQLGATVIIGSRRGKLVEQVVQQLLTVTQYNGRVYGCELNIRNRDSIIKFLDYIDYNKIGSTATVTSRVDILINNAGGQFPGPASNISPKGWNAVIDTNLTGTFTMSQLVKERYFESQKRGCIVSVIANMHNGFPMMAHTGAARAGVFNLTKTLAVEWATDGIRVNCIAPGVIASSGLGNYDKSMQEVLASSAINNYTTRFGTEAEIASSILFLCAPSSSFTTGICLNVDGAESLYSPLCKPSAHNNLPPYNDTNIDETKLPEFLRSNASANSSSVGSSEKFEIEKAKIISKL